ncbi:MAG: hypothetical protein ACPHP2_10385 [Limisphaerales bacterium]
MNSIFSAWFAFVFVLASTAEAKPVRLKFEFAKAKLYSFIFGN